MCVTRNDCHGTIPSTDFYLYDAEIVSVLIAYLDTYLVNNYCLGKIINFFFPFVIVKTILISIETAYKEAGWIVSLTEEAKGYVLSIK